MWALACAVGWKRLMVAVAVAVAGTAVAPARAAQFSVSTTADSGAGSLRQALLDANASPGADTIAIAATGSVSLSSALPDVAGDVTINGPGADSFAVTRGAGGAFRLLTVDPGVSATISGLRLSGGDAGNDASGGGGVLNRGDLSLRSVIVSGNTAGTRGGGIASETATLTVSQSTIANNTVDGGISNNFFGGGVYVDGQGSATITASTIYTNSSMGSRFSGGGGGIGMGPRATVAVSDSTISGNAASDRGGGIGSFYGQARLTLTSVTLAGNGGFAGGGVNGGNVYIEGSGANASAVSMLNTLVGAPLGLGVVNCSGEASYVSLGHNLDSGTTCQFTQGTDITSVDPRLGALAANGGPTLTRALLPGSLAIDNGTSAGLTADQRGVTRPQGPASDIGAYEAEVVAPAPTPAPVPAATPPAPKPAAVVPAKLTLIDSPIRTFWNVGARGTKVLQFLIRQLPENAAVAITCAGTGCPFHAKKVKVKGSGANALALFKNRRLRPGVVLEVRITAPNRIGKVARYTIRKNKLPTSRQLCLPPGTSKPKNAC